MPRVRLTDISISKLPQSKARITYWDKALPAFGIRVGARRKTFIVVMNGGRRIKLGNYPFTSLKDARREAHQRLSDPSGQSAVMYAEPAGEVVKKFIEIHHAQSRPRSRKEQERLLTKHFLSKYKDVPLNCITMKEILAITDALKELPSEQLHAHRALKTLFTWARKREMIEVSPLDGLDRPNEPADRERVLTDKELVAIYARRKGWATVRAHHLDHHSHGNAPG
jgi:Arm DNA-binding domain